MGIYVNSVSNPPTSNSFNKIVGDAESLARKADSIVTSISTSGFPFSWTPIDTSTVDTQVNLVTPSDIGDAVLPDPYIPPFPDIPVIDIPALDLSGLTIPEFNIDDPVFNLPNRPNEFNESAPIKPTVDYNKQFPDAPTVNIPSVPTLQSLNLPSDPLINLPLFNEPLPDLNILPNIQSSDFNYSEPIYNSNLLDAIKTELLSRLNGGTGLSPTVEQAIWNRGRDREHIASLQAERNLLVEQAGTGLNRPSGASQAALDAIRMETQGKVIELSREIMIKQAELEQENFKFSMQQAINLEQILISHFDTVQNRILDVAKYKFQVLKDIFSIALSKYNAEVELYKTSIIAFETKLKAELSKLEIFKAKLDAQKLVSEINSETINLYSAQIDAVKTVTEVYKTQVSAVSEQLRAEGLKIESYKADVDSYRTLVQAKSEEFKAYSENIKAEVAKADVFNTRVKGYVSRIQAYATAVDAETKKAEFKIKAQSLKSDVFSTLTDAYFKWVQSENTKSSIALDKYKTKLQKYLSEVSFNTASANIALKQIDQQISQIQYNTSQKIETAKAFNEFAKANSSIINEQLKASGSIYAQLASSAYNAVNVNMSSQESIGNNLNESYSTQG